MTVEEFVPPHNETAEKFILGTLLTDPASEKSEDVYTSLRSSDWFLSRNRLLFEILHAMYISGKQIEPGLVYQEIIARKLNEEIPSQYFADLCQYATNDPKTYADAIRDTAAKRRGICLCIDIIKRLKEHGEPASQIVAEMESQIFDVTSEQPTSDLRTISQAMQSALATIDDRNTQGIRRTGIPTGLSDLDKWITGNGWMPNKLIVIGARPGHGKTAFAIKQMHEAAIRGFPVLFFSLEMTAEEIMERLLSMTTEIPLYKIIGEMQIDQNAARAMNQTGQRLSSTPIWIDDREEHNIHTIAAIARRAVKKHGVKLIIIDYLQIMQHLGDNPKDDHRIRVGHTSRKLKQLAKKLGVPVIALAQINRESEKNERPTMSHIRDSGNIEQDADTIILLHPKTVEKETLGQYQTIDAIIGKQRAGAKAIVPLTYNRKLTRFEDYSPGYDHG